ncbi:MAG: hypothetical protein IT204_21815 [Fimbriimonadaceae bacterium]|nr:hypothetical protein [Fimbriimonadaceae bacterium]
MSDALPTGGSRLLARLRALQPEAKDGVMDPQRPLRVRSSLSGLQDRLGQQIRTARQTAELLLVFGVAEQGPSLGKLTGWLSNDPQAVSPRGQLWQVAAGDPAYVLLEVARADLAARVLHPGVGLRVLLVVPGRALRLEFRRASLLHWRAHPAAPPQVLVRVVTDEYVEHPLSAADGLLGRVAAVLRERDYFEGCLGTALADVATPLGASVWEVRTLVAQDGAQSGHLALFQPQQLECLWSADAALLAEHLNQGLEVTAAHVPASSWGRR